MSPPVCCAMVHLGDRARARKEYGGVQSAGRWVNILIEGVCAMQPAAG
jgi:hypothetical protein